MATQVESVLEKLAREVELAVHALYRGEVRQATAKARTGHLIRDAMEALQRSADSTSAPPVAPEPPDGSMYGAVSPRTPATRPSIAGAAVGWSDAEGEAVMKCITAWLPMGPPSQAAPDSRCIASGREMVPTWRERELARGAVRKLNPA